MNSWILGVGGKATNLLIGTDVVDIYAAIVFSLLHLGCLELHTY